MKKILTILIMMAMVIGLAGCNDSGERSFLDLDFNTQYELLSLDYDVELETESSASGFFLFAIGGYSSSTSSQAQCYYEFVSEDLYLSADERKVYKRYRFECERVSLVLLKEDTKPYMEIIESTTKSWLINTGVEGFQTQLEVVSIILGIPKDSIAHEGEYNAYVIK